MKPNNSSSDTFNKYYDIYDAVNDILILKYCDTSIKQISEITPYLIDFIAVLSMYNDLLQLLRWSYLHQHHDSILRQVHLTDISFGINFIFDALTIRSVRVYKIFY
jgi:hypothetical protein